MEGATSLYCAAQGVGGGGTGALVGSMAALSWKHFLGHVEVEAQVHQNAAPDAKDEEGAQPWCGSLLLDGEKGGNLRQDQVSSWRAPSPLWEPPGSRLQARLPILLPGATFSKTEWMWWGQSLRGHR